MKLANIFIVVSVFAELTHDISFTRGATWYLHLTFPTAIGFMC